MSDHERAYTVAEACERLGDISRTQFYRLVQSGDLEARKLGSRTVVLGSEIQRFLDELPATTDD